MNFAEFKQLIEGLQADHDRTKALYDLQVDMINYDETKKVINLLSRAAFGPKGWEWIEWWCWENDFGAKKLEAFDKDKNLICYDLESLYEHLEQNGYGMEKSN